MQIDFVRRAEPHVTLYLTDFQDHLVANITAAIRSVLLHNFRGVASVNLTGAGMRARVCIYVCG